MPLSLDRNDVSEIFAFRKEVLRLAGLLLLAAVFFAPAVLAQDQTIFVRHSEFAELSELVEIHADSLVVEESGNRASAQGNVRIVWGKYKLSSNKAQFLKDKMTAEAEGEVLFEDPNGVRLECRKIFLDLDAQTGFVEEGSLTLENEGYRIWGEKFLKTGPDSYEVEDGGFTACDGSWPSWRVEADKVSVRIEEYLTAWGASMWIEGMPAAYSPYLVFPVKRKRQTGFLIPKAGYSKTNGAALLLQHYWVISDSADLTSRLGYQSRRGWTEGAEFRYALAPGHGGRLDGSHLFDRQDRVNRYTVEAEHASRFSNTTKLDIEINYQGDDEYLKDLGESLDERGVEQLDSFVFFENAVDAGSFFFLSRYSQTLDAPQASTLQILPSLGLEGRETPLFGPVYFDPTIKATRFWREQGERGARVELNPVAALDLGVAGLGFSARTGYRQNLYRVENDIVARGGAFAETGFNFSLAKGYGEYVHVLEPLAVLGWSEAGRGGTPPAFDEADRFSNETSVRFSAESRLLRRLDLYQVAALDIERSYSISDGEWRAWRPEFSLTPSDSFSFAADGEFDQASHFRPLRWSAFFEGRDKRGDRIFAGKRYIEKSASYADLGGEAALYRAVFLQYRNRYSFLDHRVLEESYGLLVSHTCWELNISFSRNIMHDEDADERRYFVSLQLKGLGKIGKLKGVMP